MYDAIVVGARCAGAAAALLLSRAGYRVLLLERSRFPSDTVSTHHLNLPGLRLLERWGVLPAVLATGCPPAETLRYTVEDVTLTGRFDECCGIDAAYAPRRHVLDQVLVDAAVAAGARFRDGSSVLELLWEDGRVVGVAHGTPSSGMVTERARLIVGADGMRSTTARLAGAPTELTEAALTCAYYSYWEGLPTDFEIYERGGHLVGAVPTHGGRTLVVVYHPQAEFLVVRRDPRGTYLRAIRALAPELGDRLGGARTVECLRGTGSQLNFFRQAGGPGWVLIGDAGHHKDSITGTGMTDAFRQAQMLVDAISDGLADRVALDEALRRFARERDEGFLPAFWSTLEAARLQATPERLDLLRHISKDPTATAMFLAIAVGMEAPVVA